MRFHMAKNQTGKQEIEFHPDAWDRFRQAVHVMVRAGPQHREPKLGKPRTKGRMSRASSSQEKTK